MEIRSFKESDRPALRELYLESRIETFTWIDSSSWKLDDFDHSIIGEEILVAEEEGKSVGFIAFFKAESFIHHLYVDVEHKKRGIGKELLHAALRCMQGSIRLKCLVNNKNAVLFYKKQGWKFEMSGEDISMGRYYLLKKERVS